MWDFTVIIAEELIELLTKRNDMTRYEWLRWLSFPLMTVHLQTVRRDINTLVGERSKTSPFLSILDVGGRKSPYTIGVSAKITLLDVPQEDGTRKELNLGFTENILKNIQKNRSNIEDLIIQDMTKSTLRDASFDAVACVEVIEHVEEDEKFVENISKVIKKGGWAYFTTPNGDFIKNEGPGKNKDHVRHYTRAGLKSLMERHFETVEVHYAVKTGKYRVMGLKGMSWRKPLLALKTVYGNMVNKIQSKGLHTSAEGTAHLVAIGYR